MTTYRELNAAWWAWAWALEFTIKRSTPRQVVEATGSIPFAYGGTTWTVQAVPQMSRNGRVRAYIYLYVSADGRVLDPPN